MPFIKNYNEAMKLLTSIEKGKCSGNCKTIWMRNLKYALKTKSNPLKLNKTQHKSMTKKINQLSSRKSIRKTKKK